MKNEMKTPLFEKRIVTELSDNEMTNIDGGTTPAIVTSSTWCIGGAVFVATAVAGYIFGH